jgi:transcription antitermination factor NusG
MIKLLWPVDGQEAGPVISSPSELDQPRCWFAVHTSSNQEKRVGQHLEMRGIEVFLPQYTAIRRWKNRTTVKIERPLFTGYLFAKIARTERVRILEIPNVVSLVGRGKELIPVPDEEIEVLRAGIGVRRVDPYPYLKVGTRARIRSGAMAGLEGVLVRKDGSLRVVVSIESIMRSVAVHVLADEVEPCGPEAGLKPGS